MSDTARVVCAGKQAADLLHRGSGVVHSVFGKAVNLLVDSEGEKHHITLLASDVHPYGLTCSHPPSFFSDLVENMEFACCDRQIVFSQPGLPVVSWKEAEIWEQPLFFPQASSQIMRQNRIRLRRLLDVYSYAKQWRGMRVFDRIETLLRNWEANSCSFPPADFLERLTPLVGLGPGLTPLGDDFISGYIVAAHLWMDTEAGRRQLRAACLSLMEKDTTFFSKSQLNFAGSGICLRSIFEVIRALASACPLDIALVNQVLSVGATSGYGWLLGIETAFRQKEEHISRQIDHYKGGAICGN